MDSKNPILFQHTPDKEDWIPPPTKNTKWDSPFRKISKSVQICPNRRIQQFKKVNFSPESKSSRVKIPVIVSNAVFNL